MRLPQAEAEEESRKQRGLRATMTEKMEAALAQLQEENLGMMRQLRARDAEYIAMRGLDKAGEVGFWVEREVKEDD